MTGPTIQDLNYAPNTQSIYAVNDLVTRMGPYGLLPANAPQQTGSSLFPNTDVTAYDTIYTLGSNTLLQVGYKSKTDDDPKFRLAFICASGSFAEKVGAGTITMPEAESAGQEPESGNPQNPPISISPSEININDEFTLTIDVPGADGVRLWEGRRDQMVYEVPLGEFTTFQLNIQSFTPGTAIFYVTTSHNGIWSDEPDGIARVVTKLPQNLQGLNVIPAKSEEDFLGNWKTAYAGMNDGKGGYTTYRLDLSQESLFTFRSGQLTISMEGDTTYFDTRFEDGILFTKSGTFELTNDGHLSWVQESGMVAYMEKVSDPAPDDQTEQPVTNNNTVSDKIVLTVSDHEVETGHTIKINVSAPGANAIRLYTQGSDHPQKEVNGDALEYSLSSVTAFPPETYYATASFGGVWSDERSNAETVSWKAASLLRIFCPNIIHVGESFDIEINEVENTDRYHVRIDDASGNPVYEKDVNAGHAMIEPLPAGKYKLTVSCVGNESHYVTMDLEFSNTEGTMYQFGLIEESQQ